MAGYETCVVVAAGPGLKDIYYLSGAQ